MQERRVPRQSERLLLCLLSLPFVLFDGRSSSLPPCSMMLSLPPEQLPQLSSSTAAIPSMHVLLNRISLCFLLSFALSAKEFAFLPPPPVLAVVLMGSSPSWYTSGGRALGSPPPLVPEEKRAAREDSEARSRCVG